MASLPAITLQGRDYQSRYLLDNSLWQNDSSADGDVPNLVESKNV